MSEVRNSVEVTSMSAGAILLLFIAFWAQGGWYRIDCALSVTKACDIIRAEYEKKERP